LGWIIRHSKGHVIAQMYAAEHGYQINGSDIILSLEDNAGPLLGMMASKNNVIG